MAVMKMDGVNILEGKAKAFLAYDEIRFDTAKNVVELYLEGARIAYTETSGNLIPGGTLSITGLSGFCRLLSLP